jgi:mannitol/fructose-specific phosphotransferase system IIA component
MKQVKLLIQIPESLKAKLDALRSQGYTASGYIRSLLERELNKPSTERKAR